MPGFVLVAGTVLLAGCSSSAPSMPVVAGAPAVSSGAVATPDVASYLHTGTTVVFLQWTTDAEGNLSGTARQELASGDAPNETAVTRSAPLSGRITQSSITLDFGYWSNSTGNGDHWGTVYGIVSANALAFNLALQNGQFENVTFQSGSVDRYNQAVAAVTTKVTQDNQQAQDKINQQQQQAQQQDREILGKERGFCSKVGGKWSTDFDTCTVTYTASFGTNIDYPVYFDRQGNVIPANSAVTNGQDCSHWYPHSTWHGDSLICAE